jgi:hypothetical protein
MPPVQPQITNNRRRRLRLILPRLQLRLILTFFGVSALSMVVQYLVFLRVLAAAAARLPNDGTLLVDRVSRDLGLVLLVSFGLLLPLTLLVGVLATQRVAGPIYRFETYLTQILAGETSGECRLRQGDELTELCELINQSTAPLRARSARSESDEARSARRAA